MKNIICSCLQISEEELKKVIDSGIFTLDAVKEETGVSTGCGRCAAAVSKLLSEPKSGAAKHTVVF